MPQQDFDRHIIAGLVKALDWFDNSLQRILRQRGYEPVHRTQSLMLVHIASGIVRPSDIAREMGHTRQNTHQMVKPLIKAGLIEQIPDPSDGRSTLYRFTDDAAPIRDTALEILAHLETVLERRIGKSKVSALRTALALDWGPEVDEMP